MKKCCFNLRIQDALKSVFDRYSAILRGGGGRQRKKLTLVNYAQR